jgi:glycosyltransferase involved in cell wall biosynthesis
MDVTIIVTTWGHPSWVGLASRVAIPSVADQARIYHHHAEGAASAGAARNEAVEIADPQEWICFLDADDELAPGYVDAMERANLQRDDLGTPALQLPGETPRCLEDRDILAGLNPCPIGTLIHRSMFEEAGQFWGEPAWEDWSLFRRAVLSGAYVHFVPDAVYIANSTSNGRNSGVINPRRLRRDIVRSHLDWFKS